MKTLLLFVLFVLCHLVFVIQSDDTHRNEREVDAADLELAERSRDAAERSHDARDGSNRLAERDFLPAIGLGGSNAANSGSNAGYTQFGSSYGSRSSRTRRYGGVRRNGGRRNRRSSEEYYYYYYYDDDEEGSGQRRRRRRR